MKEPIKLKTLGSNPNNEAFKEYLSKHLKVSTNQKKVKKNGAEKIVFWILLALFMLGMIPLLIAIIKQGTWISGSLPFWIIFEMMTFFGTLVCGLIWSQHLKANKAAIIEAIPEDIYSQYVKYAYPNLPLDFKGLSPSQKFPGKMCMTFEAKGENIVWDIEEHTETRTEHTKDGTRTYTVYVMQYILTAYTKKLDGYEEIIFSRRFFRHAPRNPGKDEFVSASMSFNKKFKVTTKNPDKLQVTKLFDPSVIQGFDDLHKVNKYINVLTLGHGQASLHWRSGDSSSPWKANLNDFSVLSLDEKNYLNQITKYLEKDFERFFNNFNVFKPFNFYRLEAKPSSTKKDA